MDIVPSLSHKIKKICPNADYCLEYGIKTGEIKKIFGEYTNLSDVVRISSIGQPSINGFIRQLTYEKRLSPIEIYQSTGVLKSSQDIEGADNLFYEYQVGVYLNYLSTLFPIFIKTRSLLFYTSKSAYNDVLLEKWASQSHAGHWLNQRLTSPDQQTFMDQKQFMTDVCHQKARIALLLETVKQPVTIENMIDQHDQTFIKYDICSLLFLIYGVLHTVRDHYTHYDLHGSNVLLIPCNDPSGYFTYNLHLYDTNGRHAQEILIHSRYLPKIIDYGRNYYYFDAERNSPKFMDLLQHYRSICEHGSGFDMLLQQNSSYITPGQRNMSHDLRLVKIISDSLKSVHPVLSDIDTRIVYQQEYGTPENLTTMDQNGHINNVTDMYNYLGRLYLDPNSKHIAFPEFPSNYTSFGTFDIHLTLDPGISYIAHDFDDLPYIPVD
jgi:hypothetical protein